MTYREKCEARLERIQRRKEAGLVSARFPEVSSIVFDIKHYKQETSASRLSRTLLFWPDSSAYFHVGCLSKDCKDCTDGLDLDKDVAAMVKSHTSSREGKFECDGNGLTSSPMNIRYKVTISYNSTGKK